MKKNADEMKKIERMAHEVKALKENHRQKRPIVIEFCGAPKAGKTTCLNSLGDFLKRNGFRVKIITELATSCPVMDKESPSFNIWTATRTISSLVEAIENESKPDIVLFDRGVFDAICWFEWHHMANRISDAELKMMQAFLASERFIKYIDIVFVFSLDPEESLRREYLNLLTKKPGSIMNEKVLYAYTKAVSVICKKDLHQNIIQISGNDKLEENVYEVTEKTLEKLSEILTEKIGYFDKKALNFSSLTRETVIDCDDLGIQSCDIRFDKRSFVEESFDFIQPIPVAVFTNKKHNKILVIRKNETNTGENSPELKKDLLYVGGHIRKEDFIKKNMPIYDLFKTTLIREVNEELGISISKDLLNSQPIFIYTPDGNKSNKHMAVCFLVEVDENMRLHLDSHELILNRGKSKSGKFVYIDDIVLDSPLEEWSLNILKHFFERTVTFL